MNAEPSRPVGVIVTTVLLLVYSATVARGLTLWDAGEFLAAIHSLGIPHPPGTPLYVVVAHVWSLITAPLLGFTLAVNLFSAVCTAAAFGVLSNLLYRWTQYPVASAVAGICAGTMSTVWLNATETEVYAFALLVASLILWVANRARETQDVRWVILAAYLCGLGWSLHLTALVTVPAAFYLVMVSGIRVRFRDVAAAIGVALIAATAVLFMMIRAEHDPAINQGNPVTWSTMWEVIQRKQYPVAALWPRQAPWWIQVGNVFEYADWQFALGLNSDPGPSWFRTSITVLFTGLGIVGSVLHRMRDRLSWRVLLILLLTGTLAVVAYLNLKAGPSFGYGVLPDTALREARERDYFFIFGFLVWGLWAGYGAVMIARRYTQTARFPAMAVATAAAVVVACSPIALNWRAVEAERGGSSAKVLADAKSMLNAVPERGVFLAIGDNDTYPLWYLQEVHGFRRDVVVVTIPLLGPSWYREELARRYGLLDRSHERWLGTDATLSELRQRAAAQGRAVVHSPLPTFIDPLP